MYSATRCWCCWTRNYFRKFLWFLSTSASIIIVTLFHNSQLTTALLNSILKLNTWTLSSGTRVNYQRNDHVHYSSALLRRGVLDVAFSTAHTPIESLISISRRKHATRRYLLMHGVKSVHALQLQSPHSSLRHRVTVFKMAWSPTCITNSTSDNSKREHPHCEMMVYGSNWDKIIASWSDRKEVIHQSITIILLVAWQVQTKPTQWPNQNQQPMA